MATPDFPPADVFHAGGNLCLDLFTEAAAAAMRESVRFARQTRWDSIRSPHVFMGLLAVPDAAIVRWGQQLRANLDELLGQFQEFFHQEDGDPEAALALHREFLSDNVLRLLRQALNRAAANGRSVVTPMDLLITLLTASNSIVAHCFEQLGGITAAHLTEMAVQAEHQAGEP
jgi:ATP-dependent Clp protease ATP-binding subunit ClpA